jgi:MYXO-CTERM domain-containing protein
MGIHCAPDQVAASLLLLLVVVAVLLHWRPRHLLQACGC